MGLELARGALVGEHVAFGDAHARFVGGEVLGLEKLHRVGRDHRKGAASREPYSGLDVALGLRRPGTLQLQIEPPGKKPRPVRGELLRPGAVLEERAANVALPRPRKTSQALGTLPEPAFLHLCAPAAPIADPRPPPPPLPPDFTPPPHTYQTPH